MFRILFASALVGVAAMAAPIPTNVTFNKDVLPILQKNCQTCHRPGEIAPMSLLTYKDTRPWAKSIKTAVVSKKMPPWFADPATRHFSNERFLTQDQIDILAAWVDKGAPEGNAKDAPPPVQFPPDGWNIKPDAIYTMPVDQELPAKGEIDNYYVIVKGNFTEDTWLTGAEVRPSNRSVVHHMRVWIRPGGSNWLEGAPYGERVELNFRSPGAPAGNGKGKGKQAAPRGPSQEILAKYNPGVEPQVFTLGDAAKLVPKGSDIVFETHYTTIGTPAKDRSSIGLQFAKTAPKFRYYTTGGLANANLMIPPGDGNKEVYQEVTLDHDMRLTWLQPHMHLRGKDYTLTAKYPSGETEVLLKTGFDFNWQLGYNFIKPVDLPKGTKLIGISHFDNSASNKYNPDPTQTVRWGSQSSSEMSLMYLGVIIEVDQDPGKLFQRGLAVPVTD